MVTVNIAMAASTETTVRAGLMMIMVMRVATMVKLELMSWGML